MGILVIAALLAILLPLVGLLISDAPVRAGASFEWSAFLIYAAAIVAVIAPFVWRIAKVPARTHLGPKHPFPRWGWAGVALLAVAWTLAWTRFEWFAPLQRYTFTPLWLGYIVVVNALTLCRTGSCMLLDRPRCFLLLFPASAAFWWYFEYINRYLGNWYYVGVEGISAREYFIHASISFSTVLPAVIGTRDWLASFPRLSAGLRDMWPITFARSTFFAWFVLLLGAIAFFGIGMWPYQLYSMVWIAPLLTLVGLQAIARQPNLLGKLARGNWSAATLPAFAALVCGFFWEMWNWHSLARWEYAIPLAHRFLIFEMPVLGYAGYLPFGIVCAVIGDLVCGERRRGQE